MAVFQFHLQPVLDYKQRVEEQRQLELFQVQQELHREEQRLAWLREQEQLTINTLARAIRQGPLDLVAWRLGHLYLDAVHQRIEQQRLVIRRVEEEVEERRQRLVQAMQERQVLARLKANRKRGWQREQDLREGRLLDELGTIGYRRRQALDGQPVAL